MVAPHVVDGKWGGRDCFPATLRTCPREERRLGRLFSGGMHVLSWSDNSEAMETCTGPHPSERQQDSRGRRELMERYISVNTRLGVGDQRIQFLSPC